MIVENLRNIKEKINKTVIESNIKEEVTLIAVSKTKPFEMIESLYNEDQYYFGENRVQDFIDKAVLAKEKGMDKIVWHFIGHLQSNKVKHIAQYADVFHCLDSVKLAKKLNTYAKEYNRVVQVLIQINSSGEEQKSGIMYEDAIKLIKDVTDCENIQLIGLMSIGRFNSESENSREEFVKMKKLYESLSSIDQKNLDFKYLSMGMSNDFPVAIEEGANLVRIGTGIFGKRNY